MSEHERSSRVSDMRERIRRWGEQPADKRTLRIGGMLIAAEVIGLVSYFTFRAKLPEPTPPSPSAYEELAPVTNKFTIVYENQKEPRCPGAIEKIIPQKNEEGGFTGLNVICKKPIR